MPKAHAVLTPFEPNGESIEEAAQKLLDHGSQLHYLRRQNSSLANRQDELVAAMNQLQTDVGRIADGQTTCTGLMDLFNRRLAKLMAKLEVPDVEGASEILAKL